MQNSLDVDGYSGLALESFPFWNPRITSRSSPRRDYDIHVDVCLIGGDESERWFEGGFLLIIYMVRFAAFLLKK